MHPKSGQRKGVMEYQRIWTWSSLKVFSFAYNVFDCKLVCLPVFYSKLGNFQDVCWVLKQAATIPNKPSLCKHVFGKLPLLICGVHNEAHCSRP